MEWECDFINKISVNSCLSSFYAFTPTYGEILKCVCLIGLAKITCVITQGIRMVSVVPHCASGFLGWQLNWFWTWSLYCLGGSGVWDTSPHYFVSLFPNQWISWMCVAFVYFLAPDLFFVLFDTLSLGQFVLPLCPHNFLTHPTASSGTFTHRDTSTLTPLMPISIFSSDHCKRNKLKEVAPPTSLNTLFKCKPHFLFNQDLFNTAGYQIHLEDCPS